jgi:hypothetical protein
MNGPIPQGHGVRNAQGKGAACECGKAFKADRPHTLARKIVRHWDDVDSTRLYEKMST